MIVNIHCVMVAELLVKLREICQYMHSKLST